MNPIILCESVYSAKEIEDIDSLALTLGMSREEVIRKAVAIYAKQCVTTHTESKSKNKISI